MSLSYYLSDGSRLALTDCRINVNADRTVRGTPEQDGACAMAQYSPASGPGAIFRITSTPFLGVRVDEFTNERLALRLPPIRLMAQDSGGTSVTVGETIVRAYVPGARFATPSRAYRP